MKKSLYILLSLFLVFGVFAPATAAGAADSYAITAAVKITNGALRVSDTADAGTAITVTANQGWR